MVWKIVCKVKKMKISMYIPKVKKMKISMYIPNINNKVSMADESREVLLDPSLFPAHCP